MNFTSRCAITIDFAAFNDFVEVHVFLYNGGLQLLGSGVQGNYEFDGLIVVHLVKLTVLDGRA